MDYVVSVMFIFQCVGELESGKESVVRHIRFTVASSVVIRHPCFRKIMGVFILGSSSCWSSCNLFVHETKPHEIAVVLKPFLQFLPNLLEMLLAQADC